MGSVLIFTSFCAQSTNQPEMTVEGILTRAVGIGGESTGWVIHLDTEAKIEGKPTKSIEASGPKEDLARLENKHVNAVGRIVIKRGIERGEWPVLEIRAIREASRIKYPHLLPRHSFENFWSSDHRSRAATFPAVTRSLTIHCVDNTM
jgi:hypothetical protein